MAKTKLEKPIVLVEAAETWNFDDNSTFVGRPTDDDHVVYEDDGKTVKKDSEGKDINLGTVFIDEEGEHWTIGHYHSIDKSLKMEIEGKPVRELKPLMEINHLGKTEVKGKPFRKFHIQILEF
ncbi:MAG: hypothetical protein MI867_10645 [Pseudomonadales bacterium]|nr:hypothetical protein [Pseudomonadales bacterium]